ncbi:MAG: N-6 DNA methylase [Polyangia bacterium]
MERKRAREVIGQLVAEFEKGRSIFKDARKYDEAKVRAGFLDPFFEALGWSVKESQRKIGKDREVVVEDRAGKGNRQRPDYGFYVGGELKFYVEAKQPSHDLATDDKAIFQLKNYVWTRRAPIGILTDFEEFYAFHGAFKPHLDKPNLGRVQQLCFTFGSYLDNFDLIYDTFSRDAVAEGSIEKLLASVLAASVRQRGQIERDLFKLRGAKAPDDDFLEALTRWREEVAKELARRNEFRDGYELTEAVQRFLDRLVFTKIAEDRGIERSLTLSRTAERWQTDGKEGTLYARMIELFRKLAPQFNGGLFSPHPLSDNAKFEDDKIILDIIKSLYYPEGQWKFDDMPVEMLGGVYEKFLGSVVRVTEGGHRAKVEQKPEVRHAGGVYYTPEYIVDAIVERTVGPFLKAKDMTPNQVLQLQIIDPACGSGSFLLGAYQYLMDWHLRYYADLKDPVKGSRGGAYKDSEGALHLSLQKKREILSSCIHGVDLDPQAVEVAQMSLYLKLLENEAEETISLQRTLEMYKADKYLPDLSHNLYCGNSLIESQDLDPQANWTTDDERRINAFDWQAENTGFASIMRPTSQGGRGGFDAVIGNPPYIRVQALTEWAPIEVDLYKKTYTTAAEGNYDIYVVFIERSVRLLRDGGRLGFIVPTKWWQASYGGPLRRLLSKGHSCAEVFDFAHEQVFEDPTTYTCIALFTKEAAPALSYHRTSPPSLRKLGVDRYKPAWEHKVPWNDLGEGPWYPGMRSDLRPLFNRLRSEGPFLGDDSICPRVFQGLKTGLDPVFVLDVRPEHGNQPTYWSKALGAEVGLEAEVLHPLVKGREMKRFAPLDPRKAVLFPYEAGQDGANLIAPQAFQRKYPLAWHYLEQNKQALEARERGRWKGPGWYQYSRNQALDVVSRPKLMTPDLVDRSLFSHDSEGRLFLLGGAAGGYGLLPAGADLVGPLLALLNSALLEWMLRPPGLSSPFRGGWFSCEARFINLLPIHLPKNSTDLAALGSLAERATAAYRKLNTARSDRDRNLAARQVEAAEHEIDDRVYRAYGVTDHERRAIHDAVVEARSAVQAGADEEDTAESQEQ